MRRKAMKLCFVASMVVCQTVTKFTDIQGTIQNGYYVISHGQFCGSQQGIGITHFVNNLQSNLIPLCSSNSQASIYYLSSCFDSNTFYVAYQEIVQQQPIGISIRQVVDDVLQPASNQWWPISMYPFKLVANPVGGVMIVSNQGLSLYSRPNETFVTFPNGFAVSDARIVDETVYVSGLTDGSDVSVHNPLEPNPLNQAPTTFFLTAIQFANPIELHQDLIPSNDMQLIAYAQIQQPISYSSIMHSIVPCGDQIYLIFQTNGNFTCFVYDTSYRRINVVEKAVDSVISITCASSTQYQKQGMLLLSAPPNQQWYFMDATGDDLIKVDLKTGVNQSFVYSAVYRSIDENYVTSVIMDVANALITTFDMPLGSLFTQNKTEPSCPTDYMLTAQGCTKNSELATEHSSQVNVGLAVGLSILFLALCLLGLLLCYKRRRSIFLSTKSDLNDQWVPESVQHELKADVKVHNSTYATRNSHYQHPYPIHCATNNECPAPPLIISNPVLLSTTALNQYPKSSLKRIDSLEDPLPNFEPSASSTPIPWQDKELPRLPSRTSMSFDEWPNENIGSRELEDLIHELDKPMLRRSKSADELYYPQESGYNKMFKDESETKSNKYSWASSFGLRKEARKLPPLPKRITVAPCTPKQQPKFQSMVMTHSRECSISSGTTLKREDLSIDPVFTPKEVKTVNRLKQFRDDFSGSSGPDSTNSDYMASIYKDVFVIGNTCA